MVYLNKVKNEHLNECLLETRGRQQECQLGLACIISVTIIGRSQACTMIGNMKQDPLLFIYTDDPNLHTGE